VLNHALSSTSPPLPITKSAFRERAGAGRHGSAQAELGAQAGIISISLTPERGRKPLCSCSVEGNLPPPLLNRKNKTVIAFVPLRHRAALFPLFVPLRLRRRAVQCAVRQEMR